MYWLHPGLNSQEGDDEESRSVNNAKGIFEMESFRHLGFVLEYNGKSIGVVIEKHQKGPLTASQAPHMALKKRNSAVANCCTSYRWLLMSTGALA